MTPILRLPALAPSLRRHHKLCYQKPRSHHYWTPQSGERITANAWPNNMHDVSQGHLSPCASNLQRTSPDEPMTWSLVCEKWKFWLVTLLPPMNPSLRQSVYCCTAKENPGKPFIPAPILAMTPIASLRWQAQLQGHGAVLMRSLKINMPFSAP